MGLGERYTWKGRVAARDERNGSEQNEDLGRPRHLHVTDATTMWKQCPPMYVHQLPDFLYRTIHRDRYNCYLKATSNTYLTVPTNQPTRTPPPANTHRK